MHPVSVFVPEDLDTGPGIVAGQRRTASWSASAGASGEQELGAFQIGRAHV